MKTLSGTRRETVRSPAMSVKIWFRLATPLPVQPLDGESEKKYVDAGLVAICRIVWHGVIGWAAVGAGRQLVVTPLEQAGGLVLSVVQPPDVAAPYATE